MNLFGTGNLLAGKEFSDTTKTVDAGYKQATKKGAKLSTVYATARPILVFASSIFLIPEKWRNVLQVLVVQLDLITQQNPDLEAVPA